MKIATLQLAAALALALMFVGCAGHGAVGINKPIAQYDTTKLTNNVETTRAKVTSASTHVTKAQVHEEDAEAVANKVEAEGTLAHSAEAQTLVKNLSDLKLELRNTQDDLTEALTQVSSAKAEVAATTENGKQMSLQLQDTSKKFDVVAGQLASATANLTKAKEVIKIESILLIVIVLLGTAYFIMKFYFHVPFL